MLSNGVISSRKTIKEPMSAGIPILSRFSRPRNSPRRYPQNKNTAAGMRMSKYRPVNILAGKGALSPLISLKAIETTAQPRAEEEISKERRNTISALRPLIMTLIRFDGRKNSGVSEDIAPPSSPVSIGALGLWTLPLQSPATGTQRLH